MTGRSRHDEHAEKIRDSIGVLRGYRFGREVDDAAHAASVALDALLDEVAAAEARAAEAEQALEAQSPEPGDVRRLVALRAHRDHFAWAASIGAAGMDALSAENLAHRGVEAMTDAIGALAAERARADKATQALARVGVPLEVLAGQIRVKPYHELTDDLQAEIEHAVLIVREALAAQPGEAGAAG